MANAKSEKSTRREYILHWNEEASEPDTVEDPYEFGSWAAFEDARRLKQYAQNLDLGTSAMFLLELLHDDVRIGPVVCTAESIASWAPAKEDLPTGEAPPANTPSYEAARLRFLQALRAATDAAVASALLTEDHADALLLGAANLVDTTSGAVRALKPGGDIAKLIPPDQPD